MGMLIWLPRSASSRMMSIAPGRSPMLAEANRTTPRSTTTTAKAKSAARTSSTGQATGKYWREGPMGRQVKAKLGAPLDRAQRAQRAAREEVHHGEREAGVDACAVEEN